MSSAAVTVVLVLFGTLLALGAWFLFQVMKQNGRLLVRLEALEIAVKFRDGTLLDPLPPGSILNDFELPLLTGGKMTLSQWRGQRLLLIFFNPACGYCQQLISSLPETPAIPTLIVSTGDAETNRKLFSSRQIDIPVVLQERDEVTKLYRVTGTPSGYLVDESGATAGALLTGRDALLPLLKEGATNAFATNHEVPRNGTGITRLRPTSESRIVRDGLKAGTQAPDFTLPRLDGEQLSLSDFAGQNVLLVFSDPACGPCTALAPKLEQIHRDSPAFRILMVSRGDDRSNREKVKELGLTFPVVLQRHWEVSRMYGMFATPIGYLIGPDGLLVSDVAVGEPGILGLISNIEKEKPIEQTV